MNNEIKVYKSSLEVMFKTTAKQMLLFIVLMCLFSDIDIKDLQNMDEGTSIFIMKQVKFVVMVIIISIGSGLIIHRKFFEVEGKQLRYVIGNKVVYEWDLNEVKLEYSYFNARKSRSKFFIIINENGKAKKIRCDHLNFVKFYNDLLEVQGKDRIKIVRESRNGLLL